MTTIDDIRAKLREGLEGGLTHVDIDGYIDAQGVRYYGKATRMPDSSWRALANVHGALCLVEVRITPKASA